MGPAVSEAAAVYNTFGRPVTDVSDAATVFGDFSPFGLGDRPHLSRLSSDTARSHAT